MQEEFERLWHELEDTTVEDAESIDGENQITDNESIRVIIVEIPVSALRG